MKTELVASPTFEDAGLADFLLYKKIQGQDKDFSINQSVLTRSLAAAPEQ